MDREVAGVEKGEKCDGGVTRKEKKFVEEIQTNVGRNKKDWKKE